MHSYLDSDIWYDIWIVDETLNKENISIKYIKFTILSYTFATFVTTVFHLFLCFKFFFCLTPDLGPQHLRASYFSGLGADWSEQFWKFSAL